MIPRPILTIALLIAAAMLVGCRQELSPAALGLLESTYQAAMRHDDTAAVQCATQFLQTYGRSDRAAEAYYLRGLASFRMSQPDAARADLQQAIDKARSQQVAMAAHLALGDLGYDSGDLTLAERMYREALELSPAPAPAAHARYRLGSVYQMQRRWNDADFQFSRLIHLNPDDPLARLARRRIHARWWSVQAGVFEDQRLARASAEGLARASLPASVQPRQQEGKLVYVVQAGRFAEYEQATALLPEVTKLCPGAFVYPTR